MRPHLGIVYPFGRPAVRLDCPNNSGWRDRCQVRFCLALSAVPRGTIYGTAGRKTYYRANSETPSLRRTIFIDRSKNDANDAAAICEAVTRPSMRFVPTKSEQQQSGLMLHRGRQLLVRQRTMLSNAIRGHMAELGIISAKGRNGTAELLEIIANADDDRIPAVARLSLDALARQYDNTTAEIRAFEKHIHAWHRWRAGQQNRTYGVGHDGTRRTLQEPTLLSEAA